MRVKAYNATTKQIIYRDMTAEETAEHEKMQTEAPEPTPTIEERMASVEEDTKAIRAILMGEEMSE